MPGERLPWVIKYRPKRISDVANQEQAKKLFIPWLQSWLRGRIPEKKAALFYGPPGCGKTSLVEAAAHEYKLELIEMNASDFRRKEDIERIAKTAATQLSLFGRRRIILLDEVDGISGTADRGGLEAILELIRVTRHPVVMTANDPWSQRLRSLREASLLVPFNRLSNRVVVEVLSRICEAEHVYCERAALMYIAKRAEGDLRSAINDLQAIAEGYGKVTLDIVEGIVASRDREYSPFEALRHLFMSKYAWQAKRAVTHSNVDYDTMMQWINENIPNQYTDPEDVWRAYEALSRASVYLGRIKRSMSWDLLSYVFDMMGPGVALARKKSKFKWVKYSFPQRIVMLARTKEVREVREALAAHLASRLHVSKAKVKLEVLPFLSIIFRERPDYAARIAIGYGLTERMVKYLAGPAANEVMEHVNMLLMRMEKPSKVTEHAPRTTTTAPATATTTAEEAHSHRRRRSTTRRTTRRRRRKTSSSRQTTLF
ncbi:MAG: replication factor C large subunit [Crenarchaeota archaeon]|nr:replication factor C large subunit [Thermoproteota archaeon]